ncbi:MAG: UDP-N-acetylmuramate--L-alanine ligase [Rhodospirillales bacterium]
MRTIPVDLGVVHFIGIGGIGMSGIAEVLHNLGHAVQGSDIAENANVQRLRAMGIIVAIGHAAENLGEAGVVVISSAVKPDNPEVAAARARLIPVVRRAEMLAELMRLKASVAVGGTHGKTTTTSMIAALFDAANYDPTVINGGIINVWASNAKVGEGDWMIVEADESDGTFVKLPATIAVVTNIDPEHLDHYGSFDAVRDAFVTFVENIPFYGFAVLCADHPEVQALIPRVSDRRVVTYGFSPQADVRALDITATTEGMSFRVEIVDRRGGEKVGIGDLLLPMHGRHNVQNALSVVAIGHELGIGEDVIRKALTRFGGVKRRFTQTGVAGGITVIDDYGHHPVEIRAVLDAARDATRGRVIAVVQPHRYTRLHDLFEEFCVCFDAADQVLVADVYPAGEEPIAGADRDSLVAGMRERGHRQVEALPESGQLAAMIVERAKPGDLVVCLGAGNITQWANALPGEIANLLNETSEAVG